MAIPRSLFESPDARHRLAVLFRRYWYPLRSMLRRDFKIRYAPTFLGVGWAALQPLLLLLLYTFVFSGILNVKFGPEAGTFGFVLYFGCGFFPYHALSEAMRQGSTSLTDNRGLLDKVIFPAEVLPAVSVLTAGVTEIIGLVLLAVFASFFGIHPSAWLLFLPVIVLLRIVLSLGLGWLVSVLNVFVNDLGQILGLLLLTLMFITPIFYPVEAVPEGMIWLVKLNPLYYVVTAYRAVILHTQNPLPALLGLIPWAIIMSAFGLWFFRRTIERAKDFL